MSAAPSDITPATSSLGQGTALVTLTMQGSGNYGMPSFLPPALQNTKSPLSVVTYDLAGTVEKVIPVPPTAIMYAVQTPAGNAVNIQVRTTSGSAVCFSILHGLLFTELVGAPANVYLYAANNVSGVIVAFF